MTTPIALLLTICALLPLANAQVGINCTQPTIDCSGAGLCTTGAPNNTCQCFDNYITFGQTYPMCNYKKKDVIAPFALEFVFGIFTGCGPFMLGQTGWGVGQLLLTWAPILLGCIFACAVGVASLKSGSACGEGWVACATFSGYCFVFLWVLATIAVQITLLVLIGGGHLNDSNGAPTQSL